MAFKILNEDELLLLTDAEKVQYEKELDIYNKRVAFVNGLEKYENVQIEPYKAKLNPICVTEPTTIEKYESQEVKAKLHTPVKLNLQVMPIEISHPENINLPIISAPMAEIKPFKSENKQPILPTLIKPVAEILEFEKPNAIKPELPKIVKPEVIVSEYAKSERVQANIPDINITAPSVEVYEEPKSIVANIPIVTINMPELVAYVAPESVPAKLPEMTNTKVEVKSVIIEKHSIPDLPKADMPDITITKYDTPDFKSTALPTAIIPDVTHSKYEFTDVKADLTFITPPNITVTKFNKSEVKAIVPEFAMPQFEKPKAIKIQKSNTEFCAPNVPVIAVNKFKQQKHELKNTPKINKAEIPDVNAILSEFLATIKSVDAEGAAI